VVADRAGEVEVGPVAVPVVAGRAALHRDAARLLPRPPVAVVVPALHLVGGGRGAPQEAGREVEVGASRRLDRGGLCGRLPRALQGPGPAGPSRLLLHSSPPWSSRPNGVSASSGALAPEPPRGASVRCALRCRELSAGALAPSTARDGVSRRPGGWSTGASKRSGRFPTTCPRSRSPCT